MTPHDTANYWPAFILLVVPLIILYGGPYGWRALVLLGALAGLASYPLITMLIVVAYSLRWIVADFAIAFFAGLGGGLGFAGLWVGSTR